MSNHPLTDEELAQEAARWTGGRADLSGWTTSPEAVPRHGESTSISLRLPTRMLEILREFARRKGIGYQVMIKRWLDDRIRLEAKTIVSRRAFTVNLRDAQILGRDAVLSFRPPESYRIYDDDNSDPAER